MNKEIFQGHWNEFKGKIKEQYGKFTDDEISQINGKLEQFLGKLQTKYGWTKEKAETELNQWFNNAPWARQWKSGATSSSTDKQHASAGSYQGQKNAQFGAGQSSEGQYGSQGKTSSTEGTYNKGQKNPNTQSDRTNREGDFRKQR